MAEGQARTLAGEGGREAVGASARAGRAAHGVARLDVFGSALRDDHRSGESDVDLLVESYPMGPLHRCRGDADRAGPVCRVGRARTWPTSSKPATPSRRP
ncbi:MAG: nucleotidyltransferase domain-containing protein [Planctomycetes bacterium]|nr:nucleotidyltransferase domain-containing protein [Planctomycetota bacterium]